MSERHQTAAADRSVLGRLFGVTTDRESYRSLAYLLLRFPIGVAYFTTFVTGLVLGLALIPLGVGVPLLVIVLGVADHAGLVEAGLLRRVLGRDVSWEPIDPNQLPVWQYLKTVATDGRSYLLFVYCLATFWIGIISFTLLVTWFSFSVVYLVAPLVFWLPGVSYRPQAGTEQLVEIGPTTITTSNPVFDLFTITTLPEALLGSVIGVIGCIAGLHAFSGVGQVLASLTEQLLTRR
ncbi:sensor domain-containing protein [Halobacteriaceae bacterium SHR40]|uniref:sensor domain-containing protein n=1 Tax=Halovenus amylolytica TaxID=2500550 RepID=UPI000FE34BFE